MLALDQDLRPLVPELNSLQILRGFDDDGEPRVEKNTAPVTLRHLLTHTCGLTSEYFDTGEGFLLRYNKHIGRTQTASSCTLSGLLSGTTLTHVPGESWGYSQGIDWAGYLIERTAGRTLKECLSERVFRPLGMKSTVFFPEVPAVTRGKEMAFPCRQKDNSLVPMERPTPAIQEYKMGGTGLCSTARDYGVFLKALLAGDLVKESTLDEMFRPQLNEGQRDDLERALGQWRNGFLMGIPEGTSLSHGIGGLMVLEDLPGKRRAGSMDWSGVSNPRWWIDRKTGVACVMFTNQWPWGDKVVGKLWDALERGVYEALRTTDLQG